MKAALTALSRKANSTASARASVPVPARSPRGRMKLKLTQVVSALSLLAAACGPMPEAQESDSEQLGHTAQMIRRARPVPNECIVVLRDATQDVRQQGAVNIAQELVSLNGGKVLRTYEHSI